MLKRYLILSIGLHLGLIISWALAYDYSWPKLLPSPAIEAQLVFKGKVRAPDLLPRKAPDMPAEPELTTESQAKIEQKPKTEAKNKAEVQAETSKKPAMKNNYAEELASLSSQFNQELSSKPAATKALSAIERIAANKTLSTSKESERMAQGPAEHSYFDQIYSLLKESFVVPPHVNGPAGYKLQADLRLFLAEDGSLSRVKLEHASGDGHYDRAVLEAAKRVNNFGTVPVLLQGMLRERGVVVELCPFKCAGP